MTAPATRYEFARFEFDGPVILASLLGDMIGAIELTPGPLQQAMLEQAAADHGGSITPPQTQHGGWGPHQWEISLLGIPGMGEDFASALRDWIKCASRTLTEGQPG